MFVRAVILIFLLAHFVEANGNESIKGCVLPGDLSVSTFSRYQP